MNSSLRNILGFFFTYGMTVAIALVYLLRDKIMNIILCKGVEIMGWFDLGNISDAVVEGIPVQNSTKE